MIDIIDLSKSNLVFLGVKPYEAAMLRIIWRDGHGGSRNIFDELTEAGYTEARPTYIVALKKYAEKGILVGNPESDAKHARVWYSPHPDCLDEKAFIERRLKHVYRRLHEEFPEHYPLSSLW